MKKMNLLLAIIIMFSIIPCILGYADYDYSVMTDEELILSQKALVDEILNRGLIKKAKMSAGIYEVGIDFPAGKYVFTAVEYNEKRYARIQVYKDKETYDKNENKDLYAETYDEILPDYGKCTITLEEGNILALRSVAFEVEKFNLLEFFNTENGL